MEIANINVRTPEGRLLWSALIVLTTSPGLMIKGQPVAGTKTTPEEMLAMLEDLATLNDKLAPDPPPDVLFAKDSQGADQ